MGICNRRVRTLLRIGIAASIVLGATPSQSEQLTFIDSFERWSVDPEARGTALVLSPDGRHLYVARQESYFISTFERDPSTGAFNYVGDAPNSFAVPICTTVDSIVACHSPYYGPQAIRFSPDGRYLYACILGVGPPFAAQSPGIIIYERDPDTGFLTQRDNVPIDGSSCKLELSADASSMFVATRGQVHVLNRDLVTGGLTPAQTLPGVEGLDRMSSVAVSADGQNLYVTNDQYMTTTGGIIAVFRRDPDSGEFQVEEVLDDGIDLPGRISSPDGVVISPDGAFVYVVAETYSFDGPPMGAVVVFSRAADTGRLTVVETLFNDDSVSNAIQVPRTILLSPDGTRLLTGGDSLALFARDEATGRLTFLGRDDHYCTFVGQFMGTAFSSDGSQIYTNATGGAGQGPTPHVIRYRVDAFGCAAEPRVDCAGSVSSSLAIRNQVDDKHDKIGWNWTGLDADGDDDLTHRNGGFAICTYADGGAGPQLVYQAYASAGMCWYRPHNGLSFTAPPGAAQSDLLRARISSVRIKSARTNLGIKQKIRLIAQRRDAEAPDLPLPTVGALRVQFVRDDGHCWEAGFDPEQVSVNSAFSFKAKAAKAKVP
jgi:6-phosphogluconolactonase (cycloisomerase 2 family)